MAKKNFLKQNEKSVHKIIIIIVLFVLLALIVPAIGAGPSAPAYWISVVNFFTSVRTHFASFWMFYTFGLAAVVYLNK